MKRNAVNIVGRKKLVLVGNGMTAHKFCEKFAKYRLNKKYDLVVIGEELFPAYDRVNLSRYLNSPSTEQLTLAPVGWYEQHKIALQVAAKVTRINAAGKTVELETGQQEKYDKLILATGSKAFLPPIGESLPEGVFVFRTLDDLAQIGQKLSNGNRAVVVGGGILGLELARALLDEKLKVTVIARHTHLMPRQLDTTAGNLLLKTLGSLGIDVLLEQEIKSIDKEGTQLTVNVSNGVEVAADIVIISAGIIPRDELAREAGIKIGPRGGIAVNDHGLTSIPDIYAIGECALVNERIWGLTLPCFEMAEVLAARLNGTFKVFTGDVVFSKLKVPEINVVSFGNSTAESDDVFSLKYFNEQEGVYRRLFFSADQKKLVGGILVGNISGLANLLQILRNKGRLMVTPEELMEALSRGASSKLANLPDAARICMCEEVSKGEIKSAILGQGITNLEELKKATRAGTGCESCVCMVEQLLEEYLDADNPPQERS